MARVDEILTVVRREGDNGNGGGKGTGGCREWIVAVDLSKTGGVVWSEGGAVTVNSSSSLFSATIVVVGKAIVHALWDGCS